MFMLGSCFISLMVISSLINFIKQRRNLLMCLMALEGVILTLGLMFIVQSSNIELFVLFILFTFGACEASLGLACLVLMMRTFGSENFLMLNNMKC